MLRQRVPAELVQGHRQADDENGQCYQRGAAAQDRGQAARPAHPGGVPGHCWGPVTPVTSEAVAEPVEVIESMPMIDSTRVGPVTVTVTWIDSVPTGVTLP